MSVSRFPEPSLDLGYRSLKHGRRLSGRSCRRSRMPPTTFRLNLVRKTNVLFFRGFPPLTCLLSKIRKRHGNEVYAYKKKNRVWIISYACVILDFFRRHPGRDDKSFGATRDEADVNFFSLYVGKHER